MKHLISFFCEWLFVGGRYLGPSRMGKVHRFIYFRIVQDKSKSLQYLACVESLSLKAYNQDGPFAFRVKVRRFWAPPMHEEVRV